jgi:fluoroacetyl-CoA thioesterase
MRKIFTAGDIKEYRTVVEPQDVAAFHGMTVHKVCSTFALAREVEWTTRMFVLEMKDADEEGIGTYLEISHEGPAFVGDEIIIKGIFETLAGVEVTCAFEARVGDRMIARGKTRQKILTLDKIRSTFGHG